MHISEEEVRILKKGFQKVESVALLAEGHLEFIAQNSLYSFAIMNRMEKADPMENSVQQ